MASTRQVCCRQTSLRAVVGTLALGVAAAAGLTSGCRRAAAIDEEGPVLTGIPARVSHKADRAQAAFVAAVGSVATSYDRAVCREDTQLAQARSNRQARTEAHLEVARAVSSARADLQRDASRITLIDAQPAPSTPDRGGWSCLQAAGKPRCVSAAASDVAGEIYHEYVRGYHLNPVTVGDVLEAFAADARWAQPYLSKPSSRADALAAIKQACRNGDSPLAKFFTAADHLEFPGVRHDLLMVRHDFVGLQQDLCGALPIYYDKVMTELTDELKRRVRYKQCRIPQWNVLWD